VNDDQAPPTFIFAPEIEQALVALCFQAPHRVATVYRELDPAIHITRLELRFILEAIDLAYRELCTADFACVIQILRELGHLEACGGAPGVNAVFEEYRYGFWKPNPETEQKIFWKPDPEAEEEIFAHYIEMLKGYALGRKNNEPVYRFNRGDLKLVPNKAKRSYSAPGFIGEGKVAGRLYRAAAWRSAEGLSISLIPK
jgi:hypothetical protein